MTITPSQLAEWARLAEAAASGPWVSTELTGESDTDLWGYLIEGPKYLVHHEHEFFYKKDSDFIAAARTAVPELIREVELLRETVSTLRHERESLRVERRRLEEERNALRAAAKQARLTLRRNGKDVDNINADCVLQNRHPYTLMRKEIDAAIAALDAALASPAPSTVSEPGSYRNARGVVSFPPDYGDKP